MYVLRNGKKVVYNLDNLDKKIMQFDSRVLVIDVNQ